MECPHCHFTTPLPAAPNPKAPKRPPAAAVALVMIILVAAIGYGTWRTHLAPPPSAEAAPSAPSPAANRASAVAPVPTVKVWNGLQGGAVTLKKGSEGNLEYAVGELANVSGQQKFGVKVVVDLFDGAGAKIGSATDYASSIDAGKTWKFRALVAQRGAVRAELTEVTEN